MKEFNAIVERNEDSYFAYIEEIEGCVAGGETYEEVKTNLQEFIEIFAEEDETVKQKITEGFAINFKVNLQSVFNLLPEVNITQLAKTGNMNPGLLRQYVSGSKKASEKQTDKIMQAIRELSNKLNSIAIAQ